MQEFDKIGEDLFNKIRGRFPSITIGNEAGEVINEPSQARFFDFEYKEAGKVLGNVSVNITEDEGMTVIYSKDFISKEDSMTKDNWYGFLKELRLFAKKRMLEFSIRDITKTNLNKRDYQFLSNKVGDETMAESKLYGTSRISYQDVDGARLVLKHTESVNDEKVSGRIRHIGSIYIESSEGERFKYPYKHLNGARAMARHVAEGGNAYDDFGKHIVSLSEEMAKLRKFKNYMNRSSVMAEGLSDYTDAVNDRIVTVRKTISNLQKKAYYKETFDAFPPAVMEDVPADVAENWIDQLTIKQFNEELKDIFPYVFKLVSEVTKAKELGPDDLVAEDGCTPAHRKANKKKKAKEDIEIEQGFERMMGQFSEDDMGDKIKAWADKYDGYIGSNGDSLPDGYVKYATSSGIPTDFIETNERAKMDEKYGEEKFEDDPGAYISDHIDEMPITKACMEELEKITGSDDIEVNAKLIMKHSDDHQEDDTMAVKIDKDGTMSKADEKDKTPLGEFILSYYDRETGEFPKGETAVLTMVEKDYGEQFIEPAKAFIEQINATYEEYQMKANPQKMEAEPEFDRMRELAGLR